MKISIAWLFDHIDAPQNSVALSTLIEQFNQITAEIEGYEKVELPLNHISFAQVIAHNTNLITVKSTEWNIECVLPSRSDCALHDWLLIYRDETRYRWITIADMGGAKEELMPPLALDNHLHAGAWKNTIEKTDHLLHVDNKSLTHRPDLWGHRGFAREIAAIFNLPLKPLDHYLVDVPLKQERIEGDVGPLHVSIKDSTCDRFAGLYMPTIDRTPSLLWMALRLARVDSKPINAIVDITNYVMLDISQPMHAYDADKLSSNKIIIRKAHNKEPLLLRDGATLELTADDTIVCDDLTPIGLAGIAGGGKAAIDMQTKSLFIIAEHFDPTSIRLSAARHKMRTEGATRHEKKIDPEQTTHALQRFLKLCDTASIAYQYTGSLLSLGTAAPQKTITVEHTFIERRLGVSIDTAFVIDTLNKLSFTTATTNTDGNIWYTITIPTFRATKDILIPEDIVEEIGRFYGYGTIPLTLPLLPLVAKNMSGLMQIRAIKQLLAQACAMRELYTYSFYDESFLRRIAWQPLNSLCVQNPVSENWQRLVTSLIPNMIKAVATDSAEHDQLRFFELARTWNPTQTDTQEKEVLAGIIFDKKHDINFYTAKSIIQKITNLIHLPTRWIPVQTPDNPWFTPYKTAYIMHNDICLGIAGIVPPSFLHTVTDGHAFVFELDAALLRSYKHPVVRYKPCSKYPTVERDISMLVPLAITVDEITDLIAHSDTRITDVTLIDFFEKKEWLDKRSLTLRFVLCDEDKTMKKEEIDLIWHKIVTILMEHDVVVR